LTGQTPDGVTAKPVDASRFPSHRDQAEVIQRAQAEWMRRDAAGRTKPIDIEMSIDIGEGFYKGDSQLRTTNRARVIFTEDGSIRTAFPMLG
jgi:hypothetical protein